MSIEVERATLPCQVCRAHVSELRRGRCWSCYQKWSETRPVGRGSACEVCSDRRRDNLRLVELHGRTVPMCHNCGTRVVRMETVPPTLDEIRSVLDRERRDDERRGGGTDQRIFPRQRRAGERRLNDGAPRAALTERNTLPSVDDLVFELSEDDMEFVEQTMVRELPAAKPTDRS